MWRALQGKPERQPNKPREEKDRITGSRMEIMFLHPWRLKPPEYKWDSCYEQTPANCVLSKTETEYGNSKR